jgi:hypothetical protein
VDAKKAGIFSFQNLKKKVKKEFQFVKKRTKKK